MRTTDGSGLRKRQQGNFTTVPNETVWDEELSTRALGLLVKIASLPDGWDLRSKWLVERSPEGREAVMVAIRELRRLGYYRVERRRRSDGTFVTGVSVSDVRDRDWAAQHAAAAEAQGGNPKWDVSLRLLDDGRVEDEPIARPELPSVEKVQVKSADGFPVNGEPVSGEPVTGEPLTGLADVKERTTTKTSTHLEGVTHVSSDDVEAPPQDIPDGTHRMCPQHRVTPALGPCPPCGDYRRAFERRQSMLDAAAAEERMAAAAAERAAQAEVRQLADAELDECGLCDDEGTAVVDIVEGGTDGKPEKVAVTTKCLHDDGRNRRAVQQRRALRANLSRRSQQPATYGARG
jgi:hypothetical protein